MERNESRRALHHLRRIAGALALIIAAAGCSRSPAGPEPIHPAEDSCGECRMQIVQPRFAAQAIDRDELPVKFDDIGCFFSWLVARPGPPGPSWVADFDTGAWIDARSAIYVATGEATPMGSGILAFSSPERAKARGTPKPLGKLLEERARR